MPSPEILHQRLVPSGINSRFAHIYPNFESYCLAMEEIIEQARIDLTPETRDLIIHANAPKEFKPDNPEQGILLIHGLFDSTHVMKNLFEHYSAKNYLVRSLLLPGHGTRPGDLLDVRVDDFIESARFAINSFKGEVDHLTVLGFSTGASLSLYHAFNEMPIDALVSFAPAIKIKNKMAFASGWHKIISQRYQRAKWFQLAADTDYSKYQSIPFNAIQQVHRLTQQLENLSEEKKLSVPQMMILTADDEVVDTHASVEFYRDHPNEKNKLILYRSTIYSDLTDIEQRCSSYPEKNILNFSHTCLPIAATHPHYGIDGDYQDLLHYSLAWGAAFKPNNYDNLHYGAVSIENLRQYTLQRLSYNPDFARLCDDIDKFIESTKS